jgi:heme exporter protein B
MRFWRQAIEIARVDLVVERRAGDTARVVLPFAIVATMVFPLALGLRLSLIREMGLGVFWALGILFGMQVALRQSASDTPEQRDLHALAGLDPAARFAGRSISGVIVMAGFLFVLGAATTLLYDLDMSPSALGALAGSTLLLSVGLTLLGTLAGEVTTGLRSRSALASLIVAPLSLPLVIGASQTVRAVDQDTGILAWILLLVATDLALAVLGVALAKPLEEASR